MTDEEILELVGQAKTFEEVRDSVIEQLLKHLDDIFTTIVGHSHVWLPEMFSQHAAGKFDFTPLEDFITKFQNINPHMTYWFSIVPLRYYLSSGFWRNHIILHNKKVRDEHPVDQWSGLSINPTEV